jgi:hypothetical protein
MRTTVVSVFQYALWLLLLAAALELSAANLPERWRWSNPTPHGGNIFDMAYGFGLTVAVAERGQIYTSEDLRFWTPRESRTTTSLRAVTFFGGRLIITGERGIVLFAESLEQFKRIDLGTSDWLEGVAASDDLIVAVGDRGAIYSSNNGTNWQRRSTSITNWLRGVAYGSGMFVAVGENGTIATSLNGGTWTRQSSVTSRHLNRVAFIEDRFWAVGDGGLTLTSPVLGIGSWSVVTSGATNSLFAASGNPNTRLLIGSGEVRLRNENLNWSNQRDPSLSYPAPNWTLYNALWEGSLYFISGRSGMMVEGFQTNSSSPYLWINRSAPIRNWLWELQHVSKFYVTVGYFGTVMTSPNGIDWDLELVPNPVTNATFFGVGGTTNMLLTVGDRGRILLSPNIVTNVVFTNSNGTLTTNEASTLGIVWHAVPPPVTNDLQGIAMLGDQFIVTGGSGTVLTSPDGTNWTRRAAATTAFLSGVASFPGGAVAVGSRGAIVTSTNAIAWTPRASNTTNWLYRVRYVGGRLIAVGQNGTILISNDGISWTARTSGTTSWLNDVTLLDDTWFIVGTQGTVLASTNTILWRGIGTITEKSLYGIAQNGHGQLVVAGVEGAIIRSQVIPDLSPVEFVDFGRATNHNLYLISGKPDQRFRIDAAWSFTNWTSGPILEFLDSSGTILFLEDTGTNAPAREFYRATLAE